MQDAEEDEIDEETHGSDPEGEDDGQWDAESTSSFWGSVDEIEGTLVLDAFHRHMECCV